jgi:tetratricopeptide (TPR) repeat protein
VVHYPADKIVEWTDKLNPQTLDDKVFVYVDKEGKERETASKKEQYYMLRSRVLLEKGSFDECIRICEEGLNTFEKLHYDNHVWFRWRIALCYEGLGEYEKSLNLQLELLQTKKEWFIQKEIAEQYYRVGDYAKSLQYALDSALNSGDTNKKINTFIVLAKALNQTGKVEEARLHEDFIAALKKGEFNKEAENGLRRIWNTLKYDTQQQHTGRIKSILPSGKAGFVEADKGKSYYFLMRDFKSTKENAQVNQLVTFYLTEGYDAKKGKKTMNAVRLEIRN